MLQELQYRGHEQVVDALLGAAAAAAGTAEGIARLLDTGSAPDAEVGSRVLDLGCGTGLVGGTWRQRGALGALLGCDISPRMAAVASGLLYERRKEGSSNKVGTTCTQSVRIALP
jgi:SAM-dependent methyltransferase